MLAQVDIGTSFFGTSENSLSELSDIGLLISRTVQLAFAAAGIIFVFLLIAGGIGIIASAGQDNPQGVEKGKQAVTSALIGFIVVFASYWIVKLIELLTGVSILV